MFIFSELPWRKKYLEKDPGKLHYQTLTTLVVTQ